MMAAENSRQNRTSVIHQDASAIPIVLATLRDADCANAVDWDLLERVFGPLVELPSEVAEPTVAERLAKRTLDIVSASLGLILLSPLWLAVAAAIKLTSRGPVCFRQVRIGQGGKPFEVVKFRSMHRDAEKMLEADDVLCSEYAANDFKLPMTDPRVTRIGRFLRSSSIDEIPQLWNVLMGDMSMVGPRPIVEAELEEYGDLKPYFLAMKPGVTGVWQVYGRSTVQYPTRAYLDACYCLTRSMRLDCRILFLDPIPRHSRCRSPLVVHHGGLPAAVAFGSCR